MLILDRKSRTQLAQKELTMKYYNNDKNKLYQDSAKDQDQNYNPNPKLQSACSKCVGYVKNCDNCGEKIEILNHRPMNYHEGSLHRCGRGRK